MFPAIGLIAAWHARGNFGHNSSYAACAAQAKAIGQSNIARMYEKAASSEVLAGLGVNSSTGAELTALIGSLAGKFFAPAVVQGAVELPLHAVVGVFDTAGIVADEVLETFQDAPIFLSNGVTQVFPSKVVCLLCHSQEFLNLRNAPALLQHEIELAVGRGLDKVFYGRLSPGSGSFGATASALADLRELTANLISVNGQQMMLAGSLDVTQRLAFLAPGGIETFPLMPAIGVGEVKGLQCFPSDQIPAGTLLAVDPSGLAASIEEITVESSPSAAVNFDDSSQMPTSLTSMFQTNSVALRVTCRFTCTQIRSEDVSTECSGIAWSEA